MQDTINEKNQRQYPRFEIPIQLRPTEVFGRKEQVQNISLGGIRIFGTKKVKVGKTLKIDFALPNGEWIMAGVQVVWAKELPSEPILKYDFGCRFTKVPSEKQQILIEQLDKISSLKIEI